MRFGGCVPRLGSRSPQLLHVALYIRAKEGIRIADAPGAPPPLRHVEATPAPRPHVASGELEAQWMDWWRCIAEHEARAAAIGRDALFGDAADVARQIVGTMGVVFDPPEFASLTGSPDLRAIVGTSYRAALNWWSSLDANGPVRVGESQAPLIPYPIVKSAAEAVAAARSVPANGLAADIGVLDVTGPWSHLVAPGYLLCSADVIRNDEAAEDVVRRAFESGLDGRAP